MKKPSWFLFLLFFAVACLDQPDCFLLNNDLVGVYFRVIGSGGADSAAVRSLSVENIIGFTIPDTRDDTLLTSIVLPVNYFTESTAVYFETPAGARQLNFAYSVQPQFVSEDCGPRYVLSGLTVENTGFDSIRIVNATPGRDATARNVEVFRCPKADVLTVAFNQLLLPAPTAAAGTRSRAARPQFEEIATGGAPLYTNVSTSTVRLPVSLDANSMTYTFDFADAFGGAQDVRDLRIDYERETRVFYRACGVQTQVRNIAVAAGTNPAFDSVSFAAQSETELRNFLSDPYETNVNVYRCPPTNLILLSFRANELPQRILLTGVTAPHLTETLYADSTVSTFQLPLNTAASSSTFTLNYEGTSRTITFDHPWVPVASSLYRNACSDLQVVNELSLSGTAAGVSIANARVLFPATTNVTIEVP